VSNLFRASASFRLPNPGAKHGSILHGIARAGGPNLLRHDRRSAMLIAANRTAWQHIGRLWVKFCQAKQPLRRPGRRTIESFQACCGRVFEPAAGWCTVYVRAAKSRVKARERDKKGHMRFKTVILLAVLAFCAIPAWSQQSLYQASANITGNFQLQSTDSGVTDHATYAGGLMLNIRYRFHNNFSFQATGAFTTLTQFYHPSDEQEQANIYEGTVALVYAFKTDEARTRPFVEAGGGVVYFSPVDTGSTPGGSKVIQYAGLGGVGMDRKVSSHWSVRLGIRALVYKPPSFNIALNTVNSVTPMIEPYIGVAYRF
jgi:outer membrane protein W